MAIGTTVAGMTLLLVPSASAAPLTFGRCGATQVVAGSPGLECGTLKVPLDRDDPSAQAISLAVQRIPPRSPKVGTIVLIAGGPGQAALPLFDELLAPLARDRDLGGYGFVSFDQRGTGQSGALECKGVFDIGLAALARCGDALGEARADYTSQDSVEDLEAVRQALGGSPLSLYAVSYGGKVAAMYAREHPDGVARMVLDSPVPVAGTGALESERVTGLKRVLNDEICGRGRCRSFVADPYRTLTRLARSLRRRPVVAHIYAADGRREAVRVSEAGLFKMIGLMDLSPPLAGLIPAAIAAADKGDAAPLARLTSQVTGATPTGVGGSRSLTAESVRAQLLARRRLGLGAGWTSSSGSSGLSLTVLAATLCSETPLPWASDSPVASRTAELHTYLAQLPTGVTAPFLPATVAHLAPVGVCRDWPATPAAPAAPTGESATPTLILSGDEDLRTPYEQDLTVAGGYSDVQLLRIPEVGHSTVTADRTGCARHAMIAFLSDSVVPPSCPAPRRGFVVPPPGRLPSAVRSARSQLMLADRGATSVADTIQEILAQPGPSGGGLRGGSWSLRGTQLIFARLSDVSGVTLSGPIQLRSFTGRLTVGGRVHGTITIKQTALSGRLNAAMVSAHITL